MTPVVGLSFFLISAFFAESPIGRVISNESLEINGITAPSRNYVPVSVGENISSGSAAVFLTFTNGSTAILNPHSEIKIEGTASRPDIRVIRGAAQYKPTAASVARQVYGAQPAVRMAPDVASGAYRSAVRTASVKAAASSAANIEPGGPTVTGGFLTAPVSLGTVIRSDSPGGGLAIFTPTGLVINLTTTVNSTTGAVSYTVTSITQTVTQPNGVQTTVKVTTGPLVGATVGGINPSATTVSISFTPVGSTTPFTGTQASQAVQTAVQAAINAGISDGTIAIGTVPPSPSPAGTGSFSSTAP
jgi:hypothetical protein